MIDSKRQPYGFGSFVKKITRPIKKIVKSPLGKAAALGLGAYFMPGIGAKAAGGWGPWASKIGGAFGNKEGILAQLFRAKDKTTGKYGGVSLGKLGLMGLMGAGATLPFLGGDDEEEIIEEGWENTPASIANIKNMAKNRDSSLSYLPSSIYAQPGYYNMAQGGIAGLANGGNPAEAQAEQMLKMEYQKYRNQGGTMSYQDFKMKVMQQAQSQGPMAQGQPQMAQPQMAAQGGRIGFYPGGPAGGASAGGNYGGNSSGGDYQGAGAGRSVAQGGQFGSSYDDRGRIDRGGNENSNQVNTILENVSAGNKLKNFAGSRNPIDLLKINPMLLGGSMLWNKFKNQDDDQASLPSGYDFSGIEDYRAEVEPKDITASKMSGFKNQDYQSFKNQQDLFGGTKVSPFEFKGLQEGTITEPGTYVGAEGGRVGRAEGGIMDLGGMEKDYRAEGGFVPIGGKEKADDVPARLSKNEFVFTADAVRNAGGGDIDQGAEVMQNMMENLEQGGQISEESQGAQGMYNNMQQLQSRMA